MAIDKALYEAPVGIADLAEHQQGQFTGNGAALHQALLEEMGE